MHATTLTMSQRFRGYLPVVVDVETGGFDAQRDALLEIAAVPIAFRGDRFVPLATVSTHVMPFPGAHIDPQSLELTGIDVDNPLRGALDESEALEHIFKPIRTAMKQAGCKRAILVGHNAHFDLAFLNAAIKRRGSKRSPFHPFSVLDTVSLGALCFGQTVLAKCLYAANIDWDARNAHSAVYDAEKTAELFCQIFNQLKDFAKLAIPAEPSSNDAIETDEETEDSSLESETSNS